MAIAYLAVLALIAEILAMFGIPSARLALITVLTLGIVGAFWALPSRRLKAQVRLFAAKHFFPHRYDYRTQWQRFVDIPAPGPQQDDLYRRALDAMVEVAECRAGALLIVEESGELVCVEERGRPELSGKRWDAAALERMRAADPVMALNPRSDDRPALSGAVPDSLGFGGEHWAFVCLRNRDKLVGAVLLSEPLVSRPLDWQDREFLLLAGRQVAAYLAEQASRDGLAEARQFDEFHRRMAFVMHDIKNLSSQMAVLSANAGKHIENPEFQADLLTTLDHSAAKLNALLNRLGRHAKESPPEPALVACDELVEGVCSEFASRTGRLVEAIIVDRLHVLACPDQLRQALTHLVQNAIDASPPDRSVTVSLSREGLNAQIEVRDQGCGMSQEFIHRKLFKPFVSTKDNGFGIGAFEARELSAAMGGRLEVQSEEGLGSRFTLVLPLSEPLVLANRREAA
jgi:putative PEP-CTERM system histidine kinase